MNLTDRKIVDIFCPECKMLRLRQEWQWIELFIICDCGYKIKTGEFVYFDKRR